ncbi:MAG TPA: ribosome biogenesis GTPase Der, partial [Alphaproteobacteria bacterium]|nr:ribosome biogenesis GTPase Der [Alphaproteobacteria bacterium]
LRYVTQIKSRPPTFILFVSRPEELPDSYSRFLVNDMRQQFDLASVPIRLYLRKGDNPYAKD